MFKERRVMHRVAARLLVHFSHYRTSRKKKSRTTRIIKRGEKAVARSLDISCGGMLLEADQSLKKGTYLDLRISLGDIILKATAKVMYQRELENEKYGLGIKFLQISEEHRKILNQYILSKMETFHAPAPA